MLYNEMYMGGVLVHGELYHARSHKYINKFRGKNGKWRYVYRLSKAASKDGLKFLNIDNRLGDSAYNYSVRKMDEDWFKAKKKSALNQMNSQFDYMRGRDSMGVYTDPEWKKVGVDGQKEWEKDVKDLQKTYDDAAKYHGAIKDTRNERKLELRNNDRARRDAATNAKVDNYSLAIRAAADKVDKILKKATKKAEKQLKKMRK